MIPATPTSTVSKPSRLKRWTKKILKISLLVYLGLGIVLYFLQTWMIFPGAATQGKPEAEVKAGHDLRLVNLPTQTGEHIAVLFGPALTPGGQPHPDAAHRPTILYFYGNGMSMSDCSDEFMLFRRLGANVAIAEFIGYGMSSGKPSERGVYTTADTAYDWLIHHQEIDPKQIIAVGRSLGSAAAIDLATRKPIAGVATFSAFTSMAEMAHQVIPWFPTSLLLRHRFENEKKMSLLNCPVFLAHGTHDSLVPFAMNARLAAAAKGKVSVVPVPGADHNNIFQIGGESLTQQLGQFIESIHDSSPRR